MSYTSVDLETQAAAAIAAIDARDEAAAVAAVLKMELILAALPDYGTGSTNAKYSREYIGTLIEQIHLLGRMRQRTHGGLFVQGDSRPG